MILVDCRAGGGRTGARVEAAEHCSAGVLGEQRIAPPVAQRRGQQHALAGHQPQGGRHCRAGGLVRACPWLYDPSGSHTANWDDCLCSPEASLKDPVTAEQEAWCALLKCF